jgi:hypothetical protein
VQKNDGGAVALDVKEDFGVIAAQRVHGGIVTDWALGFRLWA